jgi:capsular polysaccharide biosynthesis protein
MLDLSLRPATAKSAPARVDHLWIIIAIGSIMAGLPAVIAGMLATRQTPVYAARADLQYRIEGPVSSDNLRTDRRLSTQLVALTSRALLEPIAKRSGVSFDTLRKATTARIVDNSEIIRIEVHNPSRTVAAAQAQEIANAYLTSVRAEFDTRKVSLEKSIAGLVAEQDALTAKVLAIGNTTDAANAAAIAAAAVALPPGAPVTVPASPEIALLQDRYRAIEAQRLSDRSELDDLNYRIQVGGPAVLVGEPYAVTDQVSPKPVQAEIAGGLVGLTLAATTVSLYIWWRRRVA